MSDLIEKLAEHGIRLHSYAPGSKKLRCPKCQHSRANKLDESLSVTIGVDGHAVWKCHHSKCGWVGTTVEHQDRSRPIKSQRPVRPAFECQSLPPATLDWFAKRKLSEGTLNRARVAWINTWMPGCDPGQTIGAIAFPYHRKSTVVNVKYRSLDKRFRQEKGAEKIFYNLDGIGDAKTVFIVEGEIDALSLMEVGIQNVISVPDGAPAKVKDGAIGPDEDVKFSYVWACKEDLANIEKFVLATDADEPGKALAEELARRFGREKCWRVDWPSINDVMRKDANEVLTEDGPQVLRECLEAAHPWPIKSLHEASEYKDDVVSLFRHGRQRALSTGWKSLDEFLSIREGELSIVTGIPNHGKSEFIDALMVNMARAHDWKFAICSFENPPDEHLSKLVEKYLGAPFWDGPRMRMSESELRGALDWVNDHFVFIRHTEDEAPTLNWILETAGAAVMRYGIRGLVIDPWNEIEHNRAPNLTETEHVSQSLTRVRRFLRQRGVHGWFVAHPAKLYRDRDTGKTPVPSLYDISGSANWANKADLGIVVYRVPDAHPPQTEIHVKKCRFKSVGKMGMVTLEYDPPTGQYRDQRPTDPTRYSYYEERDGVVA